MKGQYRIQISNMSREAEVMLDNPKTRSAFVKDAIEFYLANRYNQAPVSVAPQVDVLAMQGLVATIKTLQEEVLALKTMVTERPVVATEQTQEVEVEIEEVVEVESQKTNTGSSLFSFEEVEVEEDEEAEELEADILNSITNMLGM